MNGSEVFILAHTGYEEYNPYYFTGPSSYSEEDFNNLCDSLVNQAAQNALVISNNTDNHEYYYDEYVGWPDIVSALIPLLEKEGFSQFKPKEARYFGTNSFDKDDFERNDQRSLKKDIFDTIVTHNEKVVKIPYDYTDVDDFPHY